ncbi:MAG: tRNA preQ1(34) S-adenosylmethionine ribosyltransferase-isomerase QueA [Planctomycetes bacterium]|jgi:S-adenosylmethionine:tRNA ribosyltransferase-isomerase|nr:tRNA preQ1(34) S-adenosylmethionine ribosyltransferase-isomerase QueA [Planctomycetota bacterium]MBT4029337.1 tRNA preQ1(34) S-adenosylmethionine ribosyltransferase-isomerase QueA [Planctomycetota bacterium]MBT4560822.1 tRNA preQ1(34) S-adenosylmethionine ribosyltransferase-isomerase QueA [Planctomycetota bacterium]MBT5101644.1 tRNA preQ1(34) S-adenosylmethionine ribosyltransferase-isomerase QueA [Planctomycetota bacterium]MBT5119364.1 tRNA preQ1(34) S-adenosylmethionine ribosyltransferase-i
MKLTDLDFTLPERLIAKHPTSKRAASRLLVTQPDSGVTHHAKFRRLADHLKAGDLLILNDTKVVPARLLAKKETGGPAEVLWLEDLGDGLAHGMVGGRRLRPGTPLFLGEGVARIELVERKSDGQWLMRDLQSTGWLELLAEFGAAPLPPYIRRMRRTAGEAVDVESDIERYQTIWAKHDGAVAAPTASLHFDDKVISSLNVNGIERATLTLHVGAGTFLPISSDEVGEHNMHSERFELPDETIVAMKKTRERGGRIIAGGTTVCRVLEAYGATGAQSGETDIFIQPGHKFIWTDALLTNFHTPKSTLLALVAAFAQHLGVDDGLEYVKTLYGEAIAERYRFYSYGDSSLWLP